MTRKQSFRPGAIDPIEHNRRVHLIKVLRRFTVAVRLATIELGKLQPAMQGVNRAAKEFSAALTTQPIDTPRKE